MISRRSVRVKVLQALYSQMIVQGDDVKSVKKLYNDSINELYLVLLTYLTYFQAMIEYTSEYEKVQEGKFLIEDRERIVDKSVFELTFYEILKDDDSFQKSVKKFKIAKYIESDYIRKMFQKILGLDSLVDYQNEKSRQNEVKLTLDIFKKVLFKNEDLKEHLESYFGNIEEDSDLIHFAMRKSMKQYEKGGHLLVEVKKAEIEKLNEFAYNLIDTTFKNSKEYEDIITPKLIGWKLERIPLIDLTIIKMAISEMLHFPQIPLKVTVNEYIEISKMFCSPKSKDFINGVLDRVMKELDHQGKIVKEGRGLK